MDDFIRGLTTIVQDAQRGFAAIGKAVQDTPVETLLAVVLWLLFGPLILLLWLFNEEDSSPQS